MRNGLAVGTAGDKGRRLEGERPGQGWNKDCDAPRVALKLGSYESSFRRGVGRLGRKGSERSLGGDPSDEGFERWERALALGVVFVSVCVLRVWRIRLVRRNECRVEELTSC